MRCLTLLLLLCPLVTFGQKISLSRYTFASSGDNKKSIEISKSRYTFRQIVGQQSAIGQFHNNNFTFNQGYLQPLEKKKNKQTKEGLKLLIYPNPTSNTFTTELPFNVEKAYITIYHTSGKLINKVVLLNEKQININTQTWPVGTYLVNVKTDYQTFVQKIIKQ